MDDVVEGFDTANPATLALLRKSVDANIAMADELGLPLVAIWLEHARQELGPCPDRTGGDLHDD